MKFRGKGEFPPGRHAFGAWSRYLCWWRAVNWQGLAWFFLQLSNECHFPSLRESSDFAVLSAAPPLSRGHRRGRGSSSRFRWVAPGSRESWSARLPAGVYHRSSTPKALLPAAQAPGLALGRPVYGPQVDRYLQICRLPCIQLAILGHILLFLLPHAVKI